MITTNKYPNDYRTDDIIHNLPLKKIKNNKIFHTNTKLTNNEQIMTNDEHILYITALNHTVTKTQKHTYTLITDIH